MKKFAFFIAAALLAFAMLFTSCDEGVEETTVPPETVEATAPETTALPETTDTPEETTAPSHTHSFSSPSVTRAATCTEAGSEERICACGEKETNTIAPLGHTEVVDKAVSATCTVAGMTEGKHCSVCGTVTVKQSEVKATGHSYKNGICTSCGEEDPSAIDPEKIYNEAIKLLNNGEYEDAYKKFFIIKDMRDVSEYLDRFVWVCGKENFSNASGVYKSYTVHTVNENGYVTETKETNNGGVTYITKYFYETDQGGLLLETVRWQVGTDENVVVSYYYDEYGVLQKQVRWLSYEDSEFDILYEYDSEGRLIKEINNSIYMPYTEEYTYTDDGKLAQSVMIDFYGNTVTKYEYDKNGFLVKETTNYYDGDGVITYEYDANGNLIKMTEPDGSITEYYDYRLFYREEIVPSVQNGTVSIIPDRVNPEWTSWSDGNAIGVKYDGKYYVIDKAGKVLAGPFDGLVCPDSEGYAVGFVRTKEVVGVELDEFDGTPYNIVKTTTVSYVIDSTDKIIFERTGSVTDSFYESTYDGEYIEHYTDGMLVTITYDSYYMGMARNYYTLHIYDSQGNKVADYGDLISHGAYINGKMVLINSECEIFAVDRTGKKIASSGHLVEQHPLVEPWYFSMIFASIGDGHYMSYFPGGYTIIDTEIYSSSDDYYHLLLSEDMETSYLINKAYVYDNRNYGTLIFAKIVENGKLSDGYYLIDVAKCKVDEKGMILPTRSAAVYDKEFASGNFYNIFGKTEKYALVSTSDGKWGFLSYDGKTLKMYDDACYFSGGVAAVKENGEIFVIDESFNRISDSVTGYDGVSACGSGWFLLRKGNDYVIAFYNEAE